MDSAIVSVIVIGVAGTAVVGLILWFMAANDREREADVRQTVRTLVQHWCVDSGWSPESGPHVAEGSPFDPGGGELVAAEGSPFDPGGSELVASARGEVAGHPAVLLLGTTDHDDGRAVYTAAVVRLPGQIPPLQVRQRHPLRRSAETVSVEAGVADPVRATLLRLREMSVVDSRSEFVDLRDGYLRVIVSHWPPGLVLDRFIAGVTELARELSADAGNETAAAGSPGLNGRPAPPPQPE
ncbi:hypothetical protein Asp14428_78010 [Actinoplanes sp. NBRC 14428]|nr:hypothetical protein Asp14428_78010 [Actinoplanes sp. NBRC 14428]